MEGKDWRRRKYISSSILKIDILSLERKELSHIVSQRNYFVLRRMNTFLKRTIKPKQKKFQSILRNFIFQNGYPKRNAMHKNNKR